MESPTIDSSTVDLLDKRQNALRGIQARRRSVPPKVPSIDTLQDRKPFLDLVNKIRGSKPASEALELLQLLYDIATRARGSYTTKEAEHRVPARTFEKLNRCAAAKDLSAKIGLRPQVHEMEEIYTIPLLASRPGIALALLNTGVAVLETEIIRLQAEEQARKDRAERERLADIGAREVVLDKIKDDRRRVAQRRAVPTTPRFEPHSAILGSQ